MRAISSQLKFRTIFISDIHLGTRGCKADFLLDFLKYTESDKLFLVGDIVDGWRLKKNWFWTQAHNDVVQKLLRKARKGTDVTYVPGNHDEFARDFLDHEFGQIKVVRDTIHLGVDGRRFLVAHGDECDGVMIYAKWLAILGDKAYCTALWLNNWFNAARRALGLPYWSLSKYLKHKVKNAVAFISNYEQAMARMAREQGADGVICGHIHHAEIKDIDGITYMNDGDWVESCSALVEHYDGHWEILHWADMRGFLPDQSLSEEASTDEIPALPAPQPAVPRIPLEATSK
ncbi:MAG: UDP-2,3-diacylglucosamine diphosphatase, partial [Rhodospirillaceae bacterium]